MSWPPTSASLMAPPPIDGAATERHIVKPRIQGRTQRIAQRSWVTPAARAPVSTISP
jgi:hypothetical protein